MLACRKWDQRQTGYYYLSNLPGSCYCTPMICALAPFPTCLSGTRPPCRWRLLLVEHLTVCELRHTTAGANRVECSSPLNLRPAASGRPSFAIHSVTQRGPPMRFAGTLVLPLRINRRWGNQPALGNLRTWCVNQCRPAKIFGRSGVVRFYSGWWQSRPPSPEDLAAHNQLESAVYPAVITLHYPSIDHGKPTLPSASSWVARLRSALPYHLPDESAITSGFGTCAAMVSPVRLSAIPAESFPSVAGRTRSGGQIGRLQPRPYSSK